ncbi:uncharacterized protein [Rutidosis leptorrhynchoides]|uniref:uncharacterized protein n=1 Tax=Rutidosis leptorrhynchoides TaxID=125765 RepID=UPI003A98F9A9
MESLLSSYASSDEDDDDHHPRQQQSPSPQRQFTASSKVSSLFSSLPRPKTAIIDDKDSTKPTSILSSIPQPESQSVSKPKRVVQFTPPILVPANKPADFEDDEDEKQELERKKRRDAEFLAQPPSVMSFLSSIPAPRNSSTLGVKPALGSGRRSVIETEPSALSNPVESEPINTNNNKIANDSVNYDTSYTNYANEQYAAKESVATEEGAYVDYASYQAYDQNVSGGDDASNYNQSYHHESFNAGYAHYDGNTWGGGSAGVIDSAMRGNGKRGRNEIPDNVNIVEVRQDELMKNRPREDQSKTTGIAFGPSYQPVSSKGKPSKLHKRKHQIGTLYHDMKAKEMELTERRAKGFLTKAQTQGKYGW